jgi:hypothetical protein
MTWTREAMLELIDLERRRSTTRRVMSAAGLLISGGLLGAGLVLLTRRARAPIPTMDVQNDAAPSADVLDAAAAPANGASAHV